MDLAAPVNVLVCGEPKTLPLLLVLSFGRHRKIAAIITLSNANGIANKATVSRMINALNKNRKKILNNVRSEVYKLTFQSFEFVMAESIIRGAQALAVICADRISAIIKDFDQKAFNEIREDRLCDASHGLRTVDTAISAAIDAACEVLHSRPSTSKAQCFCQTKWEP